MLSTENQSSSHKHFSTSLQDSVRRNDFEHFDFSSVQQFNFTTPLFSQKLEFRDSRRFPALHYAVACGDLKATKYFLGRQFDIETRDTEGNTPLMWAVRKMNLQIVSLLVEEYGANVNVQDNSGNSPLIIAASNPFASEMVLYLLEHGAKPNIGYVSLSPSLSLHSLCIES
jgi:ankyrin repeat protein